MQYEEEEDAVGRSKTKQQHSQQKIIKSSMYQNGLKFKAIYLPVNIT